jgi:hypothetical protein
MSLRAYLQNQYQPGDVLLADTWSDIVRSGARPADHQLVQGHFFYNMRQALKPDTAVVAVLREPLARTLSGLRHLQRDPNFHRLHAQAAGKTVPQMLRDPAIMLAQANVQAAALCASVPPAEIHQYLGRSLPDNPSAEASDLEDPPTLELAQRRLAAIDFLGTMDDLPSLIRELSEAMGYHPASRLSLSNQAPGAMTSLEGLSREDVDILREHNQLDLELYERAGDLITLRELRRALPRLAANDTYSCPDGAFALDLGGPVPGFGWYGAEREGDLVWRWTGPEPRFTVELGLRRGVSYRCEMRFNPPEGVQPGQLALRVNGSRVPVTLEQSPSSAVASWQVPSTLTDPQDGVCLLAIDCGSTSRMGNDLRRLGIAVASLTFTPEQSQ